MPTDPDRRLKTLISYWKGCIEAEDALSSKLSPSVRGASVVSPYDHDPFIFSQQADSVGVSDERLERFISQLHLEQDEVFYGYPVLLYQESDGKGGHKTLLAPLLMIRLSIMLAGKEYSLQVEEPIPEIGTVAMERLGLSSAEAGTVHQQLSEAFYANVSTPQSLSDSFWQILESVSSPKKVEPIDPMHTMKGTFSHSGVFGVYNRAVFFKNTPGMYNRALLQDLTQLEQREGLADSALGFLTNSNTVDPELTAHQVPVIPFEANEYQIAAIQRTMNSLLTVVTGPPGTGKSQFIENLLLSLYAQGKTVLLVSHTNEAVRVVYDRLKGEMTSVAMRTGNQEVRRTLSSQFQELLSQHQKTPDFQHATHQDLQKSWQLITRKRQELLDLLELQRRTDDLATTLSSEASDLGMPDDVFIAAHAIVADVEEIKVLIRSIQLLRASLLGGGSLWMRVIRRLSKRMFRRIADKRLQALSSLIPRQASPVIGIVDHSLPLSSLNDHSIDALHKLCAFTNSAEGLFTMEQELLTKKDRISLEREIASLVTQHIHLSKRLLQSSISKTFSTQADALGTAFSFIDRLSAWRKGDPPLRVVASALKILPLWSCTLKSVRNSFPLEKGLFDYVIFDEASQVDLPSAAPALYRARNVVVVGDPRQLTHIATISRDQEVSIAKAHGIDRDTELYPEKVEYRAVSLYTSAERSVQNVPILFSQHYRSQRQIIELCNRSFYQGSLRIMSEKDYTSWPSSLPTGIDWKDCRGESKKHPRGSRYNAKEAQEVVSLLTDSIASLAGSPMSIGIVTPFTRQRQMISKAVNDAVPPEVQQLHAIQVQTAHQFQGSEKDIMIFSLVVSQTGDGGNDAWFNSYPQVLNVALSRARNLLYIVGDKGYCASRSGILGTITATYDRLKVEDSTEKAWSAGSFDTLEESLLFEKIKERLLYTDSISLVPKRRVGPYALDLSLEGEALLDIECDGAQHEVIGGMPVIEDVRRDLYIRRHGWDVIRIPNHRIRSEIDRVVDDIFERFTRQGKSDSSA